MDEWVDGWMDGCDGWVNGWMDEWMDGMEWLDRRDGMGWLGEWMDGRIDELMGGDPCVRSGCVGTSGCGIGERCYRHMNRWTGFAAMSNSLTLCTAHCALRTTHESMWKFSKLVALETGSSAEQKAWPDKTHSVVCGSRLQAKLQSSGPKHGRTDASDTPAVAPNIEHTETTQNHFLAPLHHHLASSSA
eukprot:262543-Chlamydomonas_euryale.AAC.11